MRYLVLAVALLVAPVLVGESAAQGKWVKLAPFPEPSEELYGEAVGGKLYVFGGVAPGWKPKGLAYEYDPATDKWTKKKPMALASHHVAFVNFKDKLYAFGGHAPGFRRPRRVRIREVRRAHSMNRRGFVLGAVALTVARASSGLAQQPTVMTAAVGNNMNHVARLIRP